MVETFVGKRGVMVTSSFVGDGVRDALLERVAGRSDGPSNWGRDGAGESDGDGAAILRFGEPSASGIWGVS